MKRLLVLISASALAIAALSTSSCTKLEPSEITDEAYPFSATCMVTAKAEGIPAANTEVVFTITDLTSNRTYNIKRTTNASGTILLSIGCGTKGASVTAQLLTNFGGVNCYGTASVSLTSSNKFYASMDLNASK